MQIFTGMMYVDAAACLVIVRGWKINQEIPKKKLSHRLSVKSIEVEQPSSPMTVKRGLKSGEASSPYFNGAEFKK